MRNKLLLTLAVLASCDMNAGVNTKAPDRVRQARSNISVSPTSNLTVEQENVKKRLELDNKPGAFKHLYIVNELGKCIFYDTVKGKVTSSGKRLKPNESIKTFGNGNGGTAPIRSEDMSEDGTFGSSSEYIYWWNTNNSYRQLQVGNGSNVLITEVPIRFDEVLIDLSIELKQSTSSK